MKNSIQNATTLSTDIHIYLVKFAWTIRDGSFITDNVANAIKSHDPGRGIEYIKTFDPHKCKFVRISKADVLKFHSFCTESTEILTKHSFF